jgi:hypothetical protein
MGVSRSFIWRWTLQDFTSYLIKSKSLEITESLAWCPVCTCLCGLHGFEASFPLSPRSIFEGLV